MGLRRAVADILREIKRLPDCEFTHGTIISQDTIVLEPDKSQIDSLQTITFKEVTFEKEVRFINFQIKGFIVFENCTFYGDVKIENCSLIHNPNKHYLHSIIFHNCDFRFNNLKVENNCKFDSSFLVEQCKQFNVVTLNNSEFFFFGMNDIVLNNFNATESKFKAELNIENCEFNAHLTLYNCSSSCINWKLNTFNKSVRIEDKEVEKAFILEENTFNDTFIINPYSSIIPRSQIDLRGNKFKKSFKIKYYLKYQDKTYSGGFDDIRVAANEFDDGLVINGSRIHTTIRAFNLDSSNKLEGLLKVSDMQITKLDITGENYKANIILKNLSIKEFRITNFANYGSFQFINCLSADYDSTFRIFESYLEKLQFSGCDFSNFTKYQIENSNLSLIRSSDTKWFTFKQLEKSKKISSPKDIPVDEKNSKDYKKGQKQMINYLNSSLYLQMRDTFRQLKYAMDQQGDRVNALNFKSHEMEAYHQYLKLNHRWYHRDRLILLLGKTNSHGVNWQIPLGFIFGLTFIFYGVILFEISPKYYIGGKWIVGDYLKDYCSNIRIFPQILNPIHKLEDLTNGTNFKLSGWTYSTDFFYKIIFAFFAFQLVSSFRKFVK